MLYLFELMANASLSSVSSSPIKEPNVRSATVSGTATVLPRFAWTKIGDIKMDRRDQELLDKQMRRLTPPRNGGVINANRNFSVHCEYQFDREAHRRVRDGANCTPRPCCS
jgi:hypothetical protein